MELNYNRVHLCGQAEDVPALSHVNHGCAFYKFTLAVMRLSGQADRLPVIVPQTLLHAVPVAAGATVTVIGQLRSFNNKSGQGSRLVISVFAHQLTLGGESPFNQIQLSGILCRTPTLRRTPLGREICDIILAVNRRYGRRTTCRASPGARWRLRRRTCAPASASPWRAASRAVSTPKMTTAS